MARVYFEWRMKMNTGCPKCNVTTLVGTKDLCPMHKLEYLQYEAIKSMTAYRDELLRQVNEQERKLNELSSSTTS